MSWSRCWAGLMTLSGAGLFKANKLSGFTAIFNVHWKSPNDTLNHHRHSLLYRDGYLYCFGGLGVGGVTVSGAPLRDGLSATALSPFGSSPSVSPLRASIPSVVADFIRAHRIAQITFMPETAAFREGWSVVIGNNRFFGDTIEEAVGKAQI